MASNASFSTSAANPFTSPCRYDANSACYSCLAHSPYRRSWQVSWLLQAAVVDSPIHRDRYVPHTHPCRAAFARLVRPSHWIVRTPSCFRLQEQVEIATVNCARPLPLETLHMLAEVNASVLRHSQASASSDGPESDPATVTTTTTATTTSSSSTDSEDGGTPAPTPTPPPTPQAIVDNQLPTPMPSSTNESFEFALSKLDRCEYFNQARIYRPACRYACLLRNLCLSRHCILLPRYWTLSRSSVESRTDCERSLYLNDVCIVSLSLSLSLSLSRWLRSLMSRVHSIHASSVQRRASARRLAISTSAYQWASTCHSGKRGTHCRSRSCSMSDYSLGLTRPVCSRTHFCIVRLAADESVVLKSRERVRLLSLSLSVIPCLTVAIISRCHILSTLS